MKIGIIGLGFVGNAMLTSFNMKISDSNNSYDYEVFGYDKFKDGGIGTFEECLSCDIIFTALPTIYNEELKSYDNTPTYDVVDELDSNNYDGVIVIKSTVEPCFTDTISKKYPSINFVHNPEFLTARTAFDDFHNQKHIVLGKSCLCDTNKFNDVVKLYEKLYPDACISECSSTESESMKLFCNTFYAVKIQYFNELYLLSEKIGCNFNNVTELMIKNGWINPMHTQVPGPDGKLSYGGLCFPKDTSALLQFMKKVDVPCMVLDSCVSERNKMRNDYENCKVNKIVKNKK